MGFFFAALIRCSFDQNCHWFLILLIREHSFKLLSVLVFVTFSRTNGWYAWFTLSYWVIISFLYHWGVFFHRWTTLLKSVLFCHRCKKWQTFCFWIVAWFCVFCFRYLLRFFKISLLIYVPLCDEHFSHTVFVLVVGSSGGSHDWVCIIPIW